MDRLYVRFAGDNDFCNTVKAFVQALAPKVLLGEWREWGDVTKADIVRMFNAHAFSMYALHQCHTKTPDESLRTYLQIEEKDVYFDAEIDAFTDHNGDGCLACLGYDDIEYYVM
jgi:hypothetical protein